MSNQVRVYFEKLQGYGVNGNLVRMDLVLKTAKEEGEKEEQQMQLLVTIPDELVDEYKLLISGVMMGIKMEVDVLPNYQSATGIYIRKVVFGRDQESKREASIYTISDMGEVIYLKVEEHTAILFALTHQLPIFAEADLLTVPKSVESLSDVEELIGELIPDAEMSLFSTLHLLLRDDQLLEKYEGDLSDERLLRELSVEQMEQLLEVTIELEKYEWSQRLSVLMEQAKNKEKDGEE